MKPLAATLALLLALTTTLRSQDPADFDLSFGSNGVVVTANGASPLGGAVAVDSRGRIVVAGSVLVGGLRQISVIRYRSNGRPDPSFGSGGRSVLPLQPGMNSATAVAVAIDAADNIVLAGETDAGIGLMLVTRVLGGGPGAGTLDPSFGGGGYAGIASFDQALNVTTSKATALALDGAGRIVVAGFAFNPAPVNSGTLDLMVHRVNPDGTFDAAFNGGSPAFIDNGGTVDQATGVAIDGVGRIFVSSVRGSGATVNRITAAGIPDLAIGPSGRLQIFDSGNMLGNQIISTGIATDSTNHVVVCGSQTGGAVPGTRKLWLARFAPNSALSDWIVQENFEGDVERVEAIAIGADRNIVVAGRSSNGPGVAVIRYLPNGQRDTSFNNPFGGFADRLTGGANESANGVAIERRGAIVVGGTNAAAFFAARFGFPVLAGPGRVNLPTTQVRRSSAGIRVLVRNAGNVPMTGLRVRALGSQRRDFVVRQPLSRVLAARERTTFLVRFRPRSPGLRSATLRISTREGLTRNLQARGRGIGAG